MKAPDSGHVDGRACTHRHMDIGRASQYEQEERQLGLRILAAIAGARSAEQSAFMRGGVMIRLWDHLGHNINYYLADKIFT